MAQHQRFPLLDLARFFAALSVMAFHYGFHGGVTHLYLDAYLPAVGRYAKYGYLGLDAFFVLSGLVIAWSARGASAQTFAWRRWLRIYPTFVFAVGVTSLIVWLAADPRFTVSWPRMMAHLIVDARRLGFRFIDGAYWSIVAELFFYAMVTVGLAIPALRRHATLCLWAWLAIGAMNEFVLQSPVPAYFLLSRYCGLFITGMMLYRLHGRRPAWRDLSLLLAAMAFAVASELQASTDRFAVLDVDWSTTTVVALLLGPILLMYLGMRVQVGARTASILKLVGALTYPMYLLHQTIGCIFINRLAPRTGFPVAVLAATTFVIGLSWLIAEHVEPFLKAACMSAKARLVATQGPQASRWLVRLGVRLPSPESPMEVREA